MDNSDKIDKSKNEEDKIGKKSVKSNELRLRVIYSFLLMGGSLAAAIIGGWLWGIASAAVSGIIAYEWATLGEVNKKAKLSVTVIAAICGFLFVVGPASIEVCACIVYVAALTSVSLKGKIFAVISSAYLAFSAFALASLRMMPEWGLLYIFGLFSVVWATDSSAYAVGRWLKGPKIFPKISPNKTWSGFCGGTIAGTAAGALYSVLANIIINPDDLFKTIGNWSIIGFVLALATQAGDFVESMMKRYFGVKDTSKLIPGHGGLLDRMDGHLSAALVFILLVSVPYIAALLI